MWKKKCLNSVGVVMETEDNGGTMETIKTKDPDKILKLFREGEANLEVQNGWIYLVGGILSKLQDNKHFIAINGFWVEI